MKPDHQSFSKSIATIVSQDVDRKDFGSGFLIHKDDEATYWLTCAHVIVKVGGGQNAKLDGQLVQLFYPDEDKLLSTVKGCDLAILRVQDFLDREPLKLSVASTEGKSITILGHCQKAESKFLESIEGSLVKPLQSNENGDRTKAWKLEISSFTKDTLQPGYSGSPVIDQATGYVVGVVTRQEGDKQGIATDIESLDTIISGRLPIQFLNSDTSSILSLSNHQINSTSQVLSSDFRKLTQELQKYYDKRQEIESAIQGLEIRIRELQTETKDDGSDPDRTRLLKKLQKQRELAKKYGDLSLNKFSGNLREELMSNPKDSAHYFLDIETCINRLYWVIKFNKIAAIDDIPLKLPLSNRSRYDTIQVTSAYEELLILLEKGLTQGISGESKQILLCALNGIKEQFKLSL